MTEEPPVLVEENRTSVALGIAVIVAIALLIALFAWHPWNVSAH